MSYSIYEDNKKKILTSKDYNYSFDKETGMFIRFGETFEHDPEFAPAPEILDIEISTICQGLGKPCSFCYKTNSLKGENMNLETYKKILDKMPKVLTQVALGIGDIDSNPDLWSIMEYTRSKGIIPNITINGYNLKDEYVKKLVELCGAVSVSRYNPKDFCYDAVEKLTSLGLKQCNIHQIVAQEKIEECYELISDCKTDKRLEKLNAIVFMSLKPKGKRNNLNIIKFDDYKAIINKAIESDIPFGSDSCGSSAIYKILKEANKEEQARLYIESCESFGLFSSYINVKGEYFPCSFAEGEGEWQEGISVLDCEDFTQDIWNNEKLNKYRQISINSKDINGCRKCLIFNDINL